MTVQVFLRDESLRRTAELQDYVTLTVVLRFNAPSSWVLVTRTAEPLDVAGIVVVRNGVTLLSGPLTGQEQASQGGQVTRTLSGQDDTVWLRRTLALPVPTGPPYTAAEYDDRTGPAETVLRGYVDSNLGPSAQAGRRLPYLTLPADLGRGGQVRGRARFHVLLELLQELALAGGDLRFRIVQTGPGQLAFEVTEPVDRSGTALFSPELGNLAGYAYSRTDAAADYVIVGGQGEGTARAFVEGGAPTPSMRRRSETFRDRRDSADPAVLAQARDEALAELTAKTELSITPVDTAAVAYGLDYQLGDRVTVEVDGVRIVDVVREVTLTVNAERGEQVVPVVGTPGASNPAVPDLFSTAALARQGRRVGNLERR